tara:strand:- start:223 stop:540 length:318 start_codon:yes stop_codon:yes gene_type:complete
MSKSVIAYKSISDQANDEFGHWLWEMFFLHGFRALAVASIISAPVFLGAAALAPSGTNRLEYGATKVGEQHQFLWTYGLAGVGTVLETTGNIVGPILDNGSSEAE